MVLTNQPRNQVDVLLPDRPRSAFKWELGTQENQDDPECPEELLENKRHLSPWNPTFNEADVRLRKKMIQQWFNESKKELCDCGCGAAVSLNTDLHNKHNRALTPVTLNRPHIQRTMSTRSVRSATPTNQSRFRRQPLKRSNSVQVVTATDDTDEPHAMPHQTKQWFERVGGSKKNDRETQSLTDLFASSVVFVSATRPGGLLYIARTPIRRE
ncbi:hypothetical protein SARC_07224 [Sphaeroforma arctica JP610]|uniref:Uncharacterized protein n=1 Tax=Sphaeroforma arctica JP610 TaxID=667725 RepID=A0A0L0FUB4_9EUKA|nr:hypothetical protein SARC_07224 [Sphaeroforma arctica JP610]KNC80417.1 hypothetical protein SARC_07224 [Sphaeroforma arctica JP610]|eukprot:XP_014154319.1 hypothetical protein SARC_07224 [Sphaeroforma arctica JP610]